MNKPKDEPEPDPEDAPAVPPPAKKVKKEEEEDDEEKAEVKSEVKEEEEEEEQEEEESVVSPVGGGRRPVHGKCWRRTKQGDIYRYRCTDKSAEEDYDVGDAVYLECQRGEPYYICIIQVGEKSLWDQESCGNEVDSSGVQVQQARGFDRHHQVVLPHFGGARAGLPAFNPGQAHRARAGGSSVHQIEG